jgi:hypothetical protein
MRRRSLDLRLTARTHATDDRRMKRFPLALAGLVFSIRAAPAAEPAELALYLFDQQTPLAGAQVRIDGSVRGVTSGDGALALTLEPGKHQVSIVRDGRDVLALELELRPDENAELIATLYPDSAPSVFIESSHQDAATASAQATQAAAGPPGTLAGRIVNSENGAPVANARVFVSGTPLDIVTDAQGVFSAPISAGTYSVSVIAPEFGSQTLEGVVIVSAQTTERAIELTPSGVELPEFVVLEPFVEGSLAAFVEEKRSSSAVTDILGAAQISRAGDSDAAGALKRVTGLTLVDGKFVYVRGLGERYSSVLLNGAQIPSPDPTRRVVPLDLFPTEILEGVVVQKTYSPEMPGEFGGGTIQLRTRGFPESALFKVSATLGHADGTSFSEGFGYEGGADDWTGRDDGSRELPAALDELRRNGIFLRARSPANPNGFTPAQFEEVGERFVAPYDVDRVRIGPNHGLALSGGNAWSWGDGWKAGFLASSRYSRSYDTFDEARRYFVASNAGLEQRDETRVEGTEGEIDLSGFLVAGIEYGEGQKLRGTSMIVRQTTDEARYANGISDNQAFDAYKLEWIENELVSHQLLGEHALSFLPLEGVQLNWLHTNARANRYSPFTREYRYDLREDGERRLNDRFSLVFADLVDLSRSTEFGLIVPWKVNAGIQGSVSLGAGTLERDRDSYIRRYLFQIPAGFPGLDQPSFEQILTPENIRPGGLTLQEITTATDTYLAEQSLDFRMLGMDVNLYDKFRLTLGLREEDNAQQVTTFSVVRPNDPPVVGGLAQVDRLPAASFTWWISGSQQLRLGYSETLSRPDFRELSASPYLDPILDFVTFGNPDLEQAEITNYDVRWEYYFSPSESVSVALFRKEFVNPIEKQLLPGAGSLLLTLANAKGALNQGVELDAYKQLGFVDRWFDGNRVAQWLRLDRIDWENWFVSANYSWIDSSIELDPESSGFNTNLQRPLEGQSPYVANLQLGYQNPAATREATLLYNISGERVVQVGVDGQPDTYEQPFGQLDFNWKQKFGKQWSLRVRLRNLLDPAVEFRQGDDAVIREYRKGREIGLSLEWQPGS